MKNHKGNGIQKLGHRIAAGLLSLSLLCGTLPADAAAETVAAAAGTVAAAAAVETSWAQEYLDTLVDWDVMRGDVDGSLYPDRSITRAEFVAMVNRAYGYHDPTLTPFTDVDLASWYYDDIGIGYNVGYFTGTSSVTASPDESLTREQAVLLLARNMMMQETAGEVLGFSDSRDFSDWSRNIIRSAVQNGVISGYPDGSFRPQDEITRAEVASMLVKAIGTPIQEAGTHELGSVYGNVTINTSGVTLRNTTIAGDLYLTGGIGLGDVLLENVNVLGRIIASGAGVSNKGDSSIILRNVNADEMIVDSIGNQFVTLRAEGDTLIDTTSIRTPAYVEDRTAANLGLRYIEVDGEPGTTVQLAGNIKEVVNITPDSHLAVVEGTAEKITIDERATDSSMTIDMGARVKELNLDVGTSVTGAGDIDNLMISAAGSTVSITPDNVTIRPGVNANVGREVMDNVTAAEFSEDPRLLAGYPDVKDVAPTSASAVFSTNKRGTIYWALSALADGSVSEEDLVHPPAYGGNILQSGTISASASNTEYTAGLTGLTPDGSYYITAVMIDSRDQHSPMKVNAFTTPDNTVPAFATGYPIMTKTTCETAQVTVMTNKSCIVYYALLPANSTAPTPTDFKAASISGNLGYGSRDAVKNSTLPINVNSIYLEELESYDLYLWLTDYDNAQSSAVTKLTFKTQDETPPTVTYMEQTDAQATSIGMTYALDEAGTLYWAIVKEGEEFFRPLSGTGYTPELNDETGADKIQIQAGVGAVQKGSSNFNAAASDISFTISKLPAQTEENPQSTYDLYYVAKDAAGNFSESGKITVSVSDSLPSKVTQEFTLYNGDETDVPLANTDIRLVFSENVQGVRTEKGKRVYDEKFLELYEAVLIETEGTPAWEEARRALGDALKNHIKFYYQTGGRFVEAPTRDADGSTDSGDENDWVIDFYNATVTLEDGKMVVTFPTDTRNKEDSALNLSSGATYYFQVTGIVDYAINPNTMNPVTLPRFTTVFATVDISSANVWELQGLPDVPVDMCFQLDPLSTSSTTDDIFYDLMIWSDTALAFDLYVRDDETSNGGYSNWTKVPGTFEFSAVPGDGSLVYLTAAQVDRKYTNSSAFTYEKLIEGLKEDHVYQFAISVTRLAGSTDRASWDRVVNMEVTIAAGPQSALRLVGNGSTTETWADALANGVYSIGDPNPFAQKVSFSDTRPPEIVSPYPQFEYDDTTADLTFFLNRTGTVYYVVTPVTLINNGTGIETPVPPVAFDYNVGNDTAVPDPSKTFVPLPYQVPSSGTDRTSGVVNPLYLTEPTKEVIINGRIADTSVRQGRVPGQAGTTCSVHLTDLKPETVYYVYLMFQGTQQVVSDYALCYKFETEPLIRPILELEVNSNDSTQVDAKVDRTAEVYARLLVSTNIQSPFSDSFWDNAVDSANLPANLTGLSGISKTPSTGYKALGTTGYYYDPDYTVLNAMIDSIGSTGTCSVFDQYATSDMKDKIANGIRSGSIEGNALVGGWGPRTLDRNGSDNAMKFTLPDEDAVYICVAVARSPQGGEDAFRAARPVQIIDKVGPKVVDVSLMLELKDGRIQGEVTVIYDKYLYRIFDSVAYPLTQDASFGAPTESSDGYCGLNGVLDSSQFYKVVGTEDGVYGRTDRVRLEVSMPIGGSFTIGRGLYNKSSVAATAVVITISCSNPNADIAAGEVPQFTYTIKQQ